MPLTWTGLLYRVLFPGRARDRFEVRMTERTRADLAALNLRPVATIRVDPDEASATIEHHDDGEVMVLPEGDNDE